MAAIGQGGQMSLLPRTTLVAGLVTALLPALLAAPVTAHAAAPTAAPVTAPQLTASVAATVLPAPGDHPGLAPAGRYGWPLPGFPALVRDFDPPPHTYGRGHRGVDLAGVPGLPVLTAASGTVLFAGPVGGRPVVSIQHSGGLRTTYEPALPVVSPGDVVTTGARIGTLAAGHPGCAAPACLHWGLRRGEEYLDPLQLLLPGPLRLLPWEGRNTALPQPAR
ncbi:MAG: peptidoglycan DD-metalloendopeptidase family protein [Pseudonocardiaceae bacterium]|nr:peptidoglycan DD-metalloendopeptidase family protein [Pseudonocardiaceae bacterium]